MNEVEKHLCADIRNSFAGTEYPGDDLILIHKKIELTDHPYVDSVDAAEFFMNKKWQDIDTILLAQDNLSIAVLSPMGAAYFMPAIMIACFDINSNGQIFGFFNHFVFDHIDGDWEPEYWEKDRREFIKYLNNEQKCVIAKFMKYISHNPQDDRFVDYNIIESLNGKWKKYVE